jgi:hypothetical protein
VAVSRILAGALECERAIVGLGLAGIGLFLNEHPQRSTGNQSLRDQAAKGIIDVQDAPQLLDESVNEFCLPHLQPDR